MQNLIIIPSLVDPQGAVDEALAKLKPGFKIMSAITSVAVATRGEITTETRYVTTLIIED